MKTAYVIIITLHGLIHILGFIKGFDLKEVKELTLPISKKAGILWLIATILLLVYTVMYSVNAPYAWLIGSIAVVFSQMLIITFWQDAKFGTLPNILILLGLVVSYGYHYFEV